MNRSECNHVMTEGLASGECRGTNMAAPQPGSCVIPTSTARFDLHGRSQGRTAPPSMTQGFSPVASFSDGPEPAGRPVVNAPAPNTSHSAAGAPVTPDRPRHRLRRARVLFGVALVSVFLLGFGGGVMAFAHDDADSRMPIVQEYEKTVAPEVTVTGLEDDGAGVITILDDPTPMAASPESQSTVDDFVVDVEPAPVTDPAPSPLAGALEQAPVEAAPEPLAPYTLEINGTRVPYIHSVFATLCPDRNAALWAGSDDTTDGSYGYFVGHNPGDFACVYALVPGNYVTLCDANGNLRNYTVSRLYDIPNTTVFQDLLKETIPQGECLVMQTCIGDGSYYRIVVCQ